MIRYALKCDRGHGFDSWFHSAEAFEKVNRSGMVSCPACGSSSVEKALMTPGVQSKDEGRHTPPSALPAKDMERALADLRKQVEEGSDYVGMNFVAEARAIHEGDAPKRSIWGEAKVDDAKGLLEDGIPVTPLPFRSKSKVN